MTRYARLKKDKKFIERVTRNAIDVLVISANTIIEVIRKPPYDYLIVSERRSTRILTDQSDEWLEFLDD